MPISAEVLARHIEEFLAEAPSAVVREDGQPSFDLSSARYSISTEHDKCILHMWSPERNAVRRVVDAESRAGVLRLSVMQFGQKRPRKLEICRSRDWRTVSSRKAARSAYQRLLYTMLRRQFPDYKIERLTSAMDLEHSFGPVYARGLLVRGNSASAVLGVNSQETQASVDDALTFGIIWLDLCRRRQRRRVVTGLKLFVPAGAAAVLRARMAFMNREAASFQLYEVDASSESMEETDISDCGNIATSLMQCPDDSRVRDRFAASIAQIRGMIDEWREEESFVGQQAFEAAVLSTTEVAFRFNGLEFARVRLGLEPGSFSWVEETVFGAAGSETLLTEENASAFAKFVRRVALSRRATGDHRNPLWRLRPERWLESLIARRVDELDSRLDPEFVYAQVPAFAASDRAMIDLLTCTRQGRLAVLELKADEDIHLPLQGLDYWARVRLHHARGEFQSAGYFPGRQLSPQAPLLLLVAPALHVHPSYETVVKYLSPEIELALLGVDERWREGVRVVFRKDRSAVRHSTVLAEDPRLRSQ